MGETKPYWRLIEARYALTGSPTRARGPVPAPVIFRIISYRDSQLTREHDQPIKSQANGSACIRMAAALSSKRSGDEQDPATLSV